MGWKNETYDCVCRRPRSFLRIRTLSGKGKETSDTPQHPSRTASNESQQAGLVCAVQPRRCRTYPGTSLLERQQRRSFDRPAYLSSRFLEQGIVGKNQGREA